MSEIKAILFDCFGVVFSDDFEKAYRYFGGDPAAEHEFIEQFMFDASKGNVNWYDGIKERFGIKREQWDQVASKFAGFNLELLDYIDQKLRPNYRIGMLSNVGVEGLAEFMDYSVLEKHFDVILESAKIGLAKPEALAYEYAAEKLGVRFDECVFTDDRLPYIEGAQGVGMKTVLFENTAQFISDLEIMLNNN